MAATSSDNVMSRPVAMSFSPVQNASSRLTLVLWLAITIERFTTGDFIAFSISKPVLLELILGFAALRGGECAFPLRLAMQKPLRSGALILALPHGSFAGQTKTKNVAHDPRQLPGAFPGP